MNLLKSQLSFMFESELNDKRTKRLALVFELVLRAGLRTEELCSLKIRDFDIQNSILHVKSAKNSNNRSIPLCDKFTHKFAVEVITECIRANEFVLQLVWPHYNDTNARNYKRYLQDGWAKVRFKALGKGFDHITLHSLRHSFAIRLIEATNDVFKVQRALGHKSLTSTQSYMTAMYEKDMKSDILKAIS